MQLPYFGENLDSKERVIGILAHVCSSEMVPTADCTSVERHRLDIQVQFVHQ